MLEYGLMTDWDEMTRSREREIRKEEVLSEARA